MKTKQTQAKSTVALVECRSYDYPEVKAAVKRGISLLGGPERFASKNEKILIKPNMLVGDAPRKGSTTHPAVFKAVCEELISTGAAISYGDSPAMGSPSSVAGKNGIAAAADEAGVPPADFETRLDIFYPEGIQNKRFTIAKSVTEYDALISISKLKTHGLTRFTGAIKNQFGCVPGFLKGEYHVKMHDAVAFSKMLVDLNNYIKPRFYIMDAVIAMEGNGPRGGRLRPMNLLLFSEDPVALDATACRIINMPPEYVPTTLYAAETGSGRYKETEINLIGDPIEKFYVKDFDIIRKPVKPYRPGRGVIRFVKNSFVPRPVIRKESCINCGVCVKACPADPKALQWTDCSRSSPPVFNYNNCIRCYCCQELCPESAIFIRKGLLRRLF